MPICTWEDDVTLPPSLIKAPKLITFYLTNLDSNMNFYVDKMLISDLKRLTSILNIQWRSQWAKKEVNGVFDWRLVYKMMFRLQKKSFFILWKKGLGLLSWYLIWSFTSWTRATSHSKLWRTLWAKEMDKTFCVFLYILLLEAQTLLVYQGCLSWWTKRWRTLLYPPPDPSWVNAQLQAKANMINLLEKPEPIRWVEREMILTSCKYRETATLPLRKRGSEFEA